MTPADARAKPEQLGHSVVDAVADALDAYLDAYEGRGAEHSEDDRCPTGCPATVDPLCPTCGHPAQEQDAGPDVQEWTLCTVHGTRYVHDGSCERCAGDRNLVQVVRASRLAALREQIAVALRCETIGGVRAVLAGNDGYTEDGAPEVDAREAERENGTGPEVWIHNLGDFADGKTVAIMTGVEIASAPGAAHYVPAARLAALRATWRATVVSYERTNEELRRKLADAEAAKAHLADVRDDWRTRAITAESRALAAEKERGLLQDRLERAQRLVANSGTGLSSMSLTLAALTSVLGLPAAEQRAETSPAPACMTCRDERKVPSVDHRGMVACPDCAVERRPAAATGGARQWSCHGCVPGAGLHTYSRGCALHRQTLPADRNAKDGG